MYFTYRSQKVYYEKHGEEEKNIIILPGWGNTRPTFNSLIKRLETDYTIYILDYPSFGNSETLKEEFTIFQYAEMIQTWIKEKEITNPIIIAHSFGGRILSILTQDKTLQIQKIILIDVAGIKRKKISRWIKQIIYKALKKGIKLFPSRQRKNLYFKLQNYFASTDYKELPISMKKTFQNIISIDLKDYYKRIPNKTLILWGIKDKDTPVIDAYYLKKKIKNSKLILYPNTNHFSYLEKGKEIIQEITQFIKKEDI